MAARENASSSEGYIAVCWGCGQHVSLPLYYSVFRCGHCGALTYDYEQGSGPAKAGARRRQRRVSFVKIRDCITVGFVFLLTTVVITGGGLWSSFPILFPTTNLLFILNSLLAAALYSNVIFNLFCTSCKPAGPVEALPWGDVSRVPAGSLTDCTLCTQCEPPRPKPSRAHHCRQCGTCVQDMDHHCPFVGNCVGRSNQRHFMVFLIFASVSCLYAALVTMWAFLRHLSHLDLGPVKAAVAKFARGGGNSLSFFTLIPDVMWELLQGLQLRGVVQLYVFGIALGTAACTVILFIQQLQFVFQGVSYIDSLKHGKGGAAKAEDIQTFGEEDGLSVPLKPKGGRASVFQQRWRLLREVFGSGSVLTWLMPRVSPPPGSRACKKHKQ